MGAITVKDLHKRYDDLEAVRGISFEVAEGEVFALLGPNGAGKTTTVEILEGYRDRTSGEVDVLGHDPAKRERDLRRRVGIVLQSTGIDSFLTVAEAIEMYRGYYPHPRPVDEPTTGFDPGARRNAWAMIRNLESLGKTVFLTTHYMDEAQELARRVAIIAQGVIVAEGAPSTLGGRDLGATIIRFRPPRGAELPAIPGLAVTDGTVEVRTEEPTRTLHELTGWAVERNLELEALTVNRPSLEDVYLQLTGSGDAEAEETAAGAPAGRRGRGRR